MGHGLFSNWKQFVCFEFDKPLTAENMNTAIGQFYDNGYTVIGVTADLGPTNASFWKSLNIEIEDNRRCYLSHPRDSSLKGFVFANPPHLVKLL